MCSIYGAKSRTLFNILHDATKDRGTYAFSSAFLNHKKKKLTIIRQQGHPKDIERVESKDSDELFLGHNQAPTSSAREYDRETSHPFVSHNWVVAHNGVLTNYKDINKKYCKWNTNPVDTSCIPNLLYSLETNHPVATEHEIICDALSMLEGTFAVWIFNEKTGHVFIARQGSTLFANPETGDFCSIQSKGWVEVEEGTLYNITQTYVPAGKFKSKSPFFTL